MSRKQIAQKIRKQVYEKYNRHCAYCGCELKYKDMEVDHVIPVYRVVKTSYTHDGEWYDEKRNNNCKVIAWMPLPKAYMEKDNETR